MPMEILYAEGFSGDVGLVSAQSASTNSFYARTGGLRYGLWPADAIIYDPVEARPGGSGYYLNIVGSSGNTNILAIDNTTVYRPTGIGLRSLAKNGRLSLSWAGKGAPVSNINGMGFRRLPNSGTTYFGVTISRSNLDLSVICGNVYNTGYTVDPAVWKHYEIIWEADDPLAGDGVGKIYVVADEELVYTGAATLPNVTVEHGFSYIRTSSSGNTSTSVGPAQTQISDLIIACGGNPGDRIGPAYVLAATPTEVLGDGWSPQPTGNLLGNVNKNTGLDFGTYNRTEQYDKRLSLNSGLELAPDAAVLAVRVLQSTQSTSTIDRTAIDVNEETVHEYVHANANTPVLSVTPWLFTDPTDDQPWTPEKIESLTFGVTKKQAA